MEGLPELKEYLRQLGNEDVMPKYGRYGICGHIEVKLSGLRKPYTINHFYKTLNKWPRHSGDKDFPIPHNHLSPKEAYHSLDKWDAKTQYGKDRLELCLWLSENL